MELLTIGYEKRSLGEFTESLQERDVDVLVDVRENAFSRKPGFSKSPLQDGMEDAGIRYVHHDAVGNPSRFRKEASTIDECREMYETHMEERWDDALGEIVELLSEHRVCLMCYERKHDECHRSIVARELRARLDNLSVRPLE